MAKNKSPASTAFQAVKESFTEQKSPAESISSLAESKNRDASAPAKNRGASASAENHGASVPAQSSMPAAAESNLTAQSSVPAESFQESAESKLDSALAQLELKQLAELNLEADHPNLKVQTSSLESKLTNSSQVSTDYLNIKLRPF